MYTCHDHLANPRRQRNCPSPLLLLPASTTLALVLAMLWIGIRASEWVVGAAGSEPVYGVSALRADLAHDPRAWTGRTVRVRGVADTCAVWVVVDHSQCAVWEVSLRDTNTAGEASWMPLRLGTENALFAFLRRMPLIARLIPAPWMPEWNVPTTYRARIRPIAMGSCSGAACYAIELLDGVP